MADEAQLSVPTLVSLLLCDQVIDDRITNKKSAIGLFNTIVVGGTPVRMQQIAVMATLTEITQRTPLQLRLVRDADDTVVTAMQGHVDAPNPLAMVDLVFTLQGLQLPNAGQFAFELLAAGEILGRRRFQVVQAQPGGPPRTPPAPES